MSQYPRYVLADVTVIWSEPGCEFFHRRGTVVDIVPGSALEEAYGVGNLSPVIQAGQRGDDANLSREALAN